MTHPPGPPSQVSEINALTETKTGAAYFHCLVDALTRATEADVGFISEITEPGEKAQTIAICSTVGPAENFEYGIENSPVTDAGNAVCIIPDQAQDRFPDDYLLADLSVEGYAGVCLKNEAGDTLGFLTLLFQKEIPGPLLVSTFLTFFMNRVAAELEHRRSMKRLLETESRFHCIAEQLGDVIFVTDMQHRIQYISAASIHLFGLSPADMNGKNLVQFLTSDCAHLAMQELEKMVATATSLRMLPLTVTDSTGGIHHVLLSAVASFITAEMPETVGVIRAVPGNSAGAPSPVIH